MNVNTTPLWTAVITPLLENLEVDDHSLTRLIEAQVVAQNGLLILGSTAEALNLDLSTRKKILNHVLELKPNSPIMVGVGGNLLEEQKEWIRFLNTLPVDAYLLVTPHYARPGTQGQTHWFKSLMDLSTKPCMLYNVPGRTGTSLSLETVKALCTHERFWAIKEASGSLEKFKEYLQAAQGKPVFCGDDALFADFSLAGSAGLVSVAANSWPKETSLYVKQCLEKTFDAKELWTKASSALFTCSNPVPVKRLMFEKQMISSPTMLPPLHHLDMPSADPVLKAHDQVSAWYKKES